MYSQSILQMSMWQGCNHVQCTYTSGQAPGRSKQISPLSMKELAQDTMTL